MCGRRDDADAGIAEHFHLVSEKQAYRRSSKKVGQYEAYKIKQLQKKEATRSTKDTSAKGRTSRVGKPYTEHALTWLRDGLKVGLDSFGTQAKGSLQAEHVHSKSLKELPLRLGRYLDDKEEREGERVHLRNLPEPADRGLVWCPSAWIRQPGVLERWKIRAWGSTFDNVMVQGTDEHEQQKIYYGQIYMLFAITQRVENEDHEGGRGGLFKVRQQQLALVQWYELEPLHNSRQYGLGMERFVKGRHAVIPLKTILAQVLMIPDWDHQKPEKESFYLCPICFMRTLL